ncbi:membrane protein [Gordonia phage Button]|nr:membrane protein [Gordonia phage Button]WKW84818.1 hypothetical protein SEA_JAMZY_27 [Gordonia phage Jamzy]
MSDALVILFSNIGSLAVGYIVGQAILWRRTKHGLIVPTTRVSSKRSLRLLGAVVTVIAFASLVQGAIVTSRQAESIETQTQCNNAFRATLKLRSDAANVQTQAMIDLTSKLIQIPDDAYEARRQAREEFIRAVEQYVTTKQSNPYPDPTC